jgi:hypothetical protein
MVVLTLFLISPFVLLGVGSDPVKILRAEIDVRTIGVAASVHESLRLGPVYRVALFDVLFDQPLFVKKEGVLCAVDDFSESCRDALLGVSRLICGSRLVESHPSTTKKPGPPLFLVPSQRSDLLPEVALFDSWWIKPSEAPARHFRSAVILGHSRSDEEKHIVVSNLEETALQICKLRFLDPKSQSWKPFGRLVTENGEEFVATFFAKSASKGRTGKRVCRLLSCATAATFGARSSHLKGAAAVSPSRA